MNTRDPYGRSSHMEGEIKPCGVGCAPTALPHTLLNPSQPITQEQARALLAENQELRQIIYHRASYEDELQYYRVKKMAGSVSTSDVAHNVETISKGNLTGHTLTPIPIKLPQQFIYRMLYKVLDNMCTPSELDWANKPGKLSKLKWVWQRNLLYLCPMILWSMRQIFSVCHRADPKTFNEMMKSLETYVSKNP